MNSARLAPPFGILAQLQSPELGGRGGGGGPHHPAALVEGGAVSGLLPKEETAIRARFPWGRPFQEWRVGDSADSE